MHHAFSSNVYILLLIGIFIEEDAAILPAAFLVHQHRLRFGYVLGTCVVGSVLMHLSLFLVSLRWGRDAFARRCACDPKWDAVQTSFQKRYQSSLLISRFLWGLRYPIVAVAALSKVRFWEFLLLDSVGAVFWALTMLLAGYYFGDAIEAFGHHMREHDRDIALLLFAVILIVVLVRKLRARQAAAAACHQTPACEPPTS